ncbi:hypothetical protein TWF506_002375 [Arthrobotrys conoides]|uniref:Uncharacterized protein n=1 Tax=Arthrobotrys conoides TaxID=74498 RepID=A0AAN8N519_9PEZI
MATQGTPKLPPYAYAYNDHNPLPRPQSNPSPAATGPPTTPKPPSTSNPSLLNLQYTGFTPANPQNTTDSPIDFFHPSIILDPSFHPHLLHPYPPLSPPQIHGLVINYLLSNGITTTKTLAEKPVEMEELVDTCSYIFAGKVNEQIRCDMKVLRGNDGGGLKKKKEKKKRRGVKRWFVRRREDGKGGLKGGVTVEQWIGILVNTVCEDYNRRMDNTTPTTAGEATAVAVRGTKVHMGERGVWEVVKKGVIRALGFWGG